MKTIPLKVILNSARTRTHTIRRLFRSLAVRAHPPPSCARARPCLVPSSFSMSVPSYVCVCVCAPACAVALPPPNTHTPYHEGLFLSMQVHGVFLCRILCVSVCVGFLCLGVHACACRSELDGAPHTRTITSPSPSLSLRPLRFHGPPAWVCVCRGRGVGVLVFPLREGAERTVMRVR